MERYLRDRETLGPFSGTEDGDCIVFFFPTRSPFVHGETFIETSESY
ncbi:unnamed protein product [Musa acuminata subsp. burmannicoides]